MCLREAALIVSSGIGSVSNAHFVLFSSLLKGLPIKTAEEHEHKLVEEPSRGRGIHEKPMSDSLHYLAASPLAAEESSSGSESKCEQPLGQSADCQLNDDVTDISFEEGSCDEISGNESSLSGYTDSEVWSDSEFSTESEELVSEDDNINESTRKSYTDKELEVLSVISFLTKHNLTASAGKDLLLLLQTMFPDSVNIKELKYEDLVESGSNEPHEIIHYCQVCSTPFPAEADVLRCTMANCSALRYKGPQSSQTKLGRQPRCFFVIANVKSQLQSLLQRKGMWDELKESKLKILSSLGENEVISDITDGECYRQLCGEGQFLSHGNNLSGIFNTDGVPLYSSSAVKLWPIFLCINEIEVSKRFARENTILAGIWQGKGNPPFCQYITAFGDTMADLYNDGFSITHDGLEHTLKFGVFLATVDLQAKGYILNMSMHNGEYGCSTCEEPGATVKQGKGYARQYPYRIGKPAMRNSDDLKFNKGPKATRRKRIKGYVAQMGLSLCHGLILYLVLYQITCTECFWV